MQKAGFGFKASASFPVSKAIAMPTSRAGVSPADVQRLFTAHYFANQEIHPPNLRAFRHSPLTFSNTNVEP
jgi:hypothetical protein